MPNLAELGKKAIELIKKKVPNMAQTEVFCDDMFSVDWQSQADIIYLSNVCFPEDMNKRLAKETEKCKPGTTIIVLNPFS